MIEITQNEIVDLVVERFKEFACGGIRRGVYNPNDPTGFERFEALIGMEYGFTMEKDEYGDYPMPENIEVKVNEVTWGVEFEIKTSVGLFKGYWSRPCLGSPGEWCRCNDGFFDVLKRLFMEGGEPNHWESEYFDDDGVMTNPEAYR